MKLRRNETKLLVTFRIIGVSIAVGWLIVVGILLLVAGRSHQGNTTASLSSPSPAASPVASTNSLFNAENWHMAGVVPKGTELLVTGQDLSIVQQDGSAGVRNSPVNLYGLHLVTKGSFALTIGLSNVTSPVEIALYGQPPIVEDEYRVDRASLTITLDGSTMVARVLSRTGDQVPTGETQQATINRQSSHRITVSYDGGNIRVVADGNGGVALPSYAIFSSGTEWFGFDAGRPGNTFSVDSLSIVGNGAAFAGVSDLTIARIKGGLADSALAKRADFVTGAAVALGPIVSDAGYVGLLGNFSGMTVENDLKFQTVHPVAGNTATSYNFSNADAIVDIAQRSGIVVHGHALVFGEANPAWVGDIARTNPRDLEQAMVDHIMTVVGHYKGKIKSWDVINEPLADYDAPTGDYGLRKHVWYNAMRSEYLSSALRAAHTADPTAELWINEFGLETDDDRFNDMLAIVDMLRSQNVPLTGIGFQSHIDEGDMGDGGHAIDTSILVRHMKALAVRGLKVRISELDVTDPAYYGVYTQIFAACLNQANCVGVTTWGVTDAYSSSGGLTTDGSYETGVGLLWDEKLAPTSGLGQLLNMLRK